MLRCFVIWLQSFFLSAGVFPPAGRETRPLHNEQRSKLSCSAGLLFDCNLFLFEDLVTE